MPELLNLLDKLIDVYVPFDVETRDGGFTTESCCCWGKMIKMLLKINWPAITVL